MKYITAILILLILATSCHKEDKEDQEIRFFRSIPWSIGATQPPVQDTTFSITTTTDLISLEITSDSYCPSYGILIQVINGDEIHFEKEILDNFAKDDGYQLLIDVAKEHDYDIRSASIFNANNPITCVWQGVADCNLSY